mmetsp:Transcript_10004/g.23799  ORF Transcript_10004/g.23799 Transcript_10004/m.23799 type:complete len:85 (-) Transcript_10004:18-272(-)
MGVGCAARVALGVWKGLRGADRGRKGVENAKVVTEAGVTAQGLLLLSEDGDEEWRWSRLAAREAARRGLQQAERKKRMPASALL